MFKKSTLLILTSTTLLFTACSSEKAIDTIKNTNNSEKETIAKKDVIYIIKHTPEIVCKSESFKNALKSTMEEFIKQSNTKIVNIKNIITSVQSNDVTCNTFKPSDITDLVDPICDERKVVDINENFDIPAGVELNNLIETSCVIAGDIF